MLSYHKVVVRKEFFRKFDTVMSGHFHHKSDDGQIYYLGTPYEIYWNDWEDKKGFISMIQKQRIRKNS
jgi:DNA repair exonuclease SbcCD nuclease subunit